VDVFNIKRAQHAPTAKKRNRLRIFYDGSNKGGNHQRRGVHTTFRTVVVGKYDTKKNKTTTTVDTFFSFRVENVTPEIRVRVKSTFAKVFLRRPVVVFVLR